MQQEELSLPKESSKQEVFENNLDKRSGKVILCDDAEDSKETVSRGRS